MGNEEVFLRTWIFSFVYRFVRSITRLLFRIGQWTSGREGDIESIVQFGDRNLYRTDRWLGRLAFQYTIPASIEYELYDLRFKSPLIGASFKSDLNILEIWLKMGLGGITHKTIMHKERKGNQRPRLQQVRIDRQQALINSIGLPGMGVDRFSKTLPGSVIWDYKRPIGISIGGEDVEEYYSNFLKIESELKHNDLSCYFYELNISCPNTDTGMAIGDSTNELETMLNRIRPETSVPLGVKVSPDWNDDQLYRIGEIVRSYSEMFINSGNTRFVRSVDFDLKEGSMPRGGGGLSGGPLLPRTLGMIRIFRDIGIPLMATGGISTVHHVRAAKEAGAVLFGLATALIMDPYCVPRINCGLARS